jgi:hypothetical protein
LPVINEPEPSSTLTRSSQVGSIRRVLQST